MNETRKESFRKWATFVVSTMALLVACLRDPIILTLKGTAQEVLREELARRESATASVEKRRESDSEVLKRLDQILNVLRDKSTMHESEQKVLLDVNSRLATLQARLDQLVRDQRREN